MESETSPRPRPGRPRSEQKRHSILHAAGGLFLEKGFDRTSMDAVAQRAGVSKQTVYSHFEGKEDLLTACVESKLAVYAMGAAPAVPAARPPAEALEAMARRYLDLIFDPDVLAMYRLIIGASTTHPDLARRFFEAGPRRAAATFRNLLERLAASGEVVLDSPPQAVDLLLGMLGASHMRSVLAVEAAPDDTWRDAHAAHCTRTFLRLHRPVASGR